MFISEELIAGYRIGGELVCLGCVEQNKKVLEDVLVEIKRDGVVTTEDTKENPGHYFCDRCGQPMTWFPCL